jgi:hypothetical protein
MQKARNIMIYNRYSVVCDPIPQKLIFLWGIAMSCRENRNEI